MIPSLADDGKTPIMSSDMMTGTPYSDVPEPEKIPSDKNMIQLQERRRVLKHCIKANDVLRQGILDVMQGFEEEVRIIEEDIEKLKIDEYYNGTVEKFGGVNNNENKICRKTEVESNQ